MIKELIGQSYGDFKTLKKVTPLAIQRALTFLGYRTSGNNPLIDGKMGPGTRGGMQDFYTDFDCHGTGPIADAVLEQAESIDIEEIAAAKIAIDKIQEKRLLSAAGIMIEYSSRIRDTAITLGVDPAFVGAIILTETAGLSTFRFEPHILRNEMKRTKTRREARIRATSWGPFQIMGFNAGIFLPAHHFWDLDLQFALFVSFVRRERNILLAMQTRDWLQFARLYNGPGFARNNYNRKIETAFLQFQKIIR